MDQSIQQENKIVKVNTPVFKDELNSLVGRAQDSPKRTKVS